MSVTLRPRKNKNGTTSLRIDIYVDGKHTIETLENLKLSKGNSVEVIAKKLTDDGFLMLIDGSSHLVYTKEEANSMHLTVDGKSCMLEKENDPTLLISPSPGKLVRFLVNDGDHLQSGDAYAEIEVFLFSVKILGDEDVYATFSQ